MGVAAYNRGSDRIRRSLADLGRRADRTADRRAVKALYREALDVQATLSAVASDFRLAYRQAQWSRARELRRRGRSLQSRRARLCSLIRRLGWPCSQTWLRRTSAGG